MNKVKTIYKKTIKQLASLKLAVFILVLLSVIIAWGTIIESQYDALTAKNKVYHSVWMMLTMGLLCINLTAVILDRFPWKKRHLAFILAHIGIIIVIIGSLFSYQYGIDGTMRLEKNNSQNIVTTQDTFLTLYKSNDGVDYKIIYQEKVNLFKETWSKDKPFQIKGKDFDFQLTDSLLYSVPKMNVQASEFSQAGAGVRVFISNKNVSHIEWLVQKNIFEKVEQQFGSVSVTMGGLWERNLAINEIRLIPEQDFLTVQVYEKTKKKPTLIQKVKEGDAVPLPWMGLNFQALRYYSKAKVLWEMQGRPYPTPLTTQAIKVAHQGVESWIPLNDFLKIFTESNVYLLAFANERINLPFNLNLEEFEKTNYPGSMKAMAYQSRVSSSLENTKSHHISMNNPLKLDKYLFYQASFEESPTGVVQASILSVNFDPGRFLKYLGSFLICLGTILLFYFKKRNIS